jgi:hypothetical protein
MSKTSPTDCSKSFFFRLNDLARKTKFIRRNSAKFSATGYLFSLIRAILTGKASFNQLAMGLKKSEPRSLSKQAVWKRTNKIAVAFMLEALSLTCWKSGNAAPRKFLVSNASSIASSSRTPPSKNSPKRTTPTSLPTAMVRASLQA